MNKKKVVWSIVGLITVILIVAGVSYAYWIFQAKQTGENQITTQCFKLRFEESENSNISLLEGYPMSDEDGKKLTPYTFKVSNGCNVKAKYQVRLEIDNTSTLNEQYLKVQINNGSVKKLSELKTTNTTLSNAKVSYILEEMTINYNEEKNYEIRIWIDGGVSSDNKEVMDKTFSSKVTLEGNYDESYSETILNGTDPEIKDNLIPVTIANDGTVKKADTTKEWYSYEKKNWANAVILEDETIQYNNGETIPESNIESYFVWIPRYKYQIFDNGFYEGATYLGTSMDGYIDKSQEIKVVFENRETKISKGTKKGDWLTHPAFTSFDSNGMWVGKFETGNRSASTTNEAQKNIVDTSKIQIKPNILSWAGIQISKAHLNSYNYQRELDSHLMKNTEWGAVAYLQYSKYGSMAKVRFNNNASGVTGYSAINEPTCGYTGNNEECNKYENVNPGLDGTYTVNYFNPKSIVSSTTGNYSGIYDMSGGFVEYVMGIKSSKIGQPLTGKDLANNSGFNGPLATGDIISDGINLPEIKYYDLYAFSENERGYYTRILGDATGELGPFYDKYYTTFSRMTGSWGLAENYIYSTPERMYFYRGSGYINGVGASIFAFSAFHGSVSTDMSYRIVLTPGGNL